MAFVLGDGVLRHLLPLNTGPGLLSQNYRQHLVRLAEQGSEENMMHCSGQAAKRNYLGSLPLLPKYAKPNRMLM
jgi:hypothetical protein